MERLDNLCSCYHNATHVTITFPIDSNLYFSENDGAPILFQCSHCNIYFHKNMIDDKEYIDEYYEFQTEMQKANKRLIEWSSKKTKITITIGDNSVVKYLENFTQFIPPLPIPPQ